MGYNSVVVVMNDALGMIEEDPTFGRNLAAGIRGCHIREDRDVPAYSPSGRGVHCNAAEVISTAHADIPQVVVVKGNTGFAYRYGEALPESVLEDLKFVLDQHGYSVRKKPTKRSK